MLEMVTRILFDPARKLAVRHFCVESKIIKKILGIKPTSQTCSILGLGFLLFTHCIYIMFEIASFSLVLIFDTVNSLLLCPWFFPVLGFHENRCVLVLFFYCLFLLFFVTIHLSNQLRILIDCNHKSNYNKSQLTITYKFPTLNQTKYYINLSYTKQQFYTNHDFSQ